MASGSSKDMRQWIPGKISDAAMQMQGGVLDASGESASAARFREIMGGTDGDPWCGGVSSGFSRRGGLCRRSCGGVVGSCWLLLGGEGGWVEEFVLLLLGKSNPHITGIAYHQPWKFQYRTTKTLPLEWTQTAQDLQKEERGRKRTSTRIVLNRKYVRLTPGESHSDQQCTRDGRQCHSSRTPAETPRLPASGDRGPSTACISKVEDGIQSTVENHGHPDEGLEEDDLRGADVTENKPDYQ
jgi:hypothetical protein